MKLENILERLKYRNINYFRRKYMEETVDVN